MIDLEPAGGGRFLVEASARWTVTTSLNGGWLLSAVLLAMRSISPHPHALTVTGRFARPTAPGRIEVAATAFHTGRSFAGLEGTVTDGEGRETLRALATFGRLAAPDPGPRGFVRGRPPELPPPERCTAASPTPGTGEVLGAAIRREVELRYPPGSRLATGAERGEEPVVAVWARYADGRPPDLWTLPLFVDVLPPALLGRSDAGWVPTVELSVHLRAEPAPGWLACRTESRYAFGGLLQEDAEVWDAGGTLVAQARQLALLP